MNVTIACNGRKLKYRGLIHACYKHCNCRKLKYRGLIHAYYSRRQLGPSKCFIWSNFFLCFLIISKTMMKMINIMCNWCKQLTAVIILIWSFGLDLSKCWFVNTQSVAINSLIEEFILSGYSMCFALKAMFFDHF